MILIRKCKSQANLVFLNSGIQDEGEIVPTGSGNFIHYSTLQSYLQENRAQLYILILEDLVHSFNFCYQDFGHYRQQMQVYATPFAVPMDWVSPDYQLKLIDLQSSDTKRDTF